MRERTLETSTRGEGFLAELRRSFDRSFAEAPATESAESVDLLAMHLGGAPFAVRLADTGGLITNRRVTAVPTTMPELRGVAGVRGAVVPVYDLAMLMGYPPSPTTHWILLARGTAVGFALDSFDGQLRVDAGAMVSNEATSRAYVHQIASTGEGPRPIVNISAVVAAIGERVSGRIREK